MTHRELQDQAVPLAGRLTPEQRQEFLLRLAYQLPEVFLLIFRSFDDPAKPEDGWISQS